jgi:hypothetical protein
MMPADGLDRIRNHDAHTEAAAAYDVLESDRRWRSRPRLSVLVSGPSGPPIHDGPDQPVFQPIEASVVISTPWQKRRRGAIMGWGQRPLPSSRTPGVVLMPERHITVQRRMSAAAGSVWAVYADFPNLASHWSGLRATRAIGDQTSGVGARRRVELKPIGSMDETVTTWEEGRRIDTQNQPSMSVPFKRAQSSLTLEADDDRTVATFDYRYVPRGGPIGRVTGPLIDKMLTATFTDMLAATEEAALAKG